MSEMVSLIQVYKFMHYDYRVGKGGRLLWAFAWDLKIKYSKHWKAINSFTPSCSKHLDGTCCVPGSC